MTKNIFELKQELGVAKIIKEILDLREMDNKYSIWDKGKMETLMNTYHESILIMTGNSYMSWVNEWLKETCDRDDIIKHTNRFWAALENKVIEVLYDNKREIENWELFNNVNQNRP